MKQTISTRLNEIEAGQYKLICENQASSMSQMTRYLIRKFMQEKRERK